MAGIGRSRAARAVDDSGGRRRGKPCTPVGRTDYASSCGLRGFFLTLCANRFLAERMQALPATQVDMTFGPGLDHDEHCLVNIVAHTILFDRWVNPYAGSLPVEKVQNTVLLRHPDLFRRVVGHKSRGWLDFLNRHRTVFVVFLDPFRNLRRVRVIDQRDWQVADEREEMERLATEQSIIGAVVNFVVMQPEGRRCTLDAFIDAYPQLPFVRTSPLGEPTARMLRRGDLVRLIRRYSCVIRFDNDSFELSLPS